MSRKFYIFFHFFFFFLVIIGWQFGGFSPRVALTVGHERSSGFKEKYFKKPFNSPSDMAIFQLHWRQCEEIGRAR